MSDLPSLFPGKDCMSVLEFLSSFGLSGMAMSQALQLSCWVFSGRIEFILNFPGIGLSSVPPDRPRSSLNACELLWCHIQKKVNIKI